jgi:hypothetical protein
MSPSRRSFLGAAASLVAVSAWGAASLAAQSQGQMPMPTPLDRFPIPQDALGGPMPSPSLSPAERMKMNQAEIKKNMARLKELVGDLQKDFDANNTTSVLSMNAVHKTEEIEKLARQIRGLVRG